MRKYFDDFLSRDFLKFLVVGGFAAGVNFFSRILLSHFLTFVVAVVIAYLIGMMVAFVLSKVLVFQPETGRTAKQFYYFTLVNIVAVVQTVIVSVFLVDYLFPLLDYSYYPEEIAHFIGISVPIFSSFLGHKYITFSKKESTSK
jgi:putative flippase GtrA